MGLNRKNGTLKGVKAHVRRDTDQWEKTGVVGWKLLDGGFFIGIGEQDNGYDTEIDISAKALQRMLGSNAQAKSTVFSEDPKANKWDYLEGDFPT